MSHVKRAASYERVGWIKRLDPSALDELNFTGFIEKWGAEKLDELYPKWPWLGQHDPPPAYLASGARVRLWRRMDNTRQQRIRILEGQWLSSDTTSDSSEGTPQKKRKQPSDHAPALSASVDDFAASHQQMPVPTPKFRSDKNTVPGASKVEGATSMEYATVSTDVSSGSQSTASTARDIPRSQIIIMPRPPGRLGAMIVKSATGECIVSSQTKTWSQLKPNDTIVSLNGVRLRGQGGVTEWAEVLKETEVLTPNWPIKTVDGSASRKSGVDVAEKNVSSDTKKVESGGAVAMESGEGPKVRSRRRIFVSIPRGLLGIAVARNKFGFCEVKKLTTSPYFEVGDLIIAMNGKQLAQVEGGVQGWLRLFGSTSLLDSRELVVERLVELGTNEVLAPDAISNSPTDALAAVDASRPAHETSQKSVAAASAAAAAAAPARKQWRCDVCRKAVFDTYDAAAAHEAGCAAAAAASPLAVAGAGGVVAAEGSATMPTMPTMPEARGELQCKSSVSSLTPDSDPDPVETATVSLRKNSTDDSGKEDVSKPRARTLVKEDSTPVLARKTTFSDVEYAPYAYNANKKKTERNGKQDGEHDNDRTTASTTSNTASSSFGFDSVSDRGPVPDEIGSGLPAAYHGNSRSSCFRPRPESAIARRSAAALPREPPRLRREPEPDQVGSGATASPITSKMKRDFIKHCNEDVYARLRKSRRHGVGTFALKDFRAGAKLFRNVPGVLEDDTVVLTRLEIESEILVDEVKRYIYDMFEPMKDMDDDMRDSFSLPAKGLNDLPFHYFMNAASRSNVQANAERDRQGYVTAEASRDGKRGEELLWHSNAPKIRSAGDYDFTSANAQPAAYNLNYEESRIEQAAAENAREVERLLRENAKLKSFVDRTWRPLSASGEDVGKYGVAYFGEDCCWIEVRIKSFKSADERAAEPVGAHSERKNMERPSRGLYTFEFNVRDREGKAQTEDGEVIDDWDSDEVSVGDPSVRVQEGWGD